MISEDYVENVLNNIGTEESAWLVFKSLILIKIALLSLISPFNL